MATFATLRTNLLYDLKDTSQGNYVDAELLVYANRGLRYLSKELARLNAGIAATGTSITYGTGTVSKNLPSGFIKFFNNDEGKARIFNQTEDDMQMGLADPQEVDDWESETAADTGVPDEFYVRGNDLYVHPRGDAKYDIKYYYFPTAAISTTADTVPWNGQFDDALERYIVAKCRSRSEQTGYRDEDRAEFEILKAAAYEAVFGRDGYEMNFDDSWGFR